jgi:DNA-binding Xre family transcriptional regulator
MFDNFKLYFPSMFRNTETFKEVSGTEAVVYLKDGSRVVYDDLGKTFRNLPANSECMTEAECRNEFGIRLRYLMCWRGISQIELSERTGISRVVLNRYIMGKTTPSFYAVDRIAKALGCSVDEFRYI